MDSTDTGGTCLVGTSRKFKVDTTKNGKNYEKGRIVLVTGYQPPRSPKPFVSVFNPQGLMEENRFFNLVPLDGGTPIRRVTRAYIEKYTE